MKSTTAGKRWEKKYGINRKFGIGKVRSRRDDLCFSGTKKVAGCSTEKLQARYFLQFIHEIKADSKVHSYTVVLVICTLEKIMQWSCSRVKCDKSVAVRNRNGNWVLSQTRIKNQPSFNINRKINWGWVRAHYKQTALLLNLKKDFKLITDEFVSLQNFIRNTATLSATFF